MGANGTEIPRPTDLDGAEEDAFSSPHGSPKRARVADSQSGGFQSVIEKAISDATVSMSAVVSEGLSTMNTNVVNLRNDLKSEMKADREQWTKDLQVQRDAMKDLDSSVQQMRREFEERFKIIEDEIKAKEVELKAQLEAAKQQQSSAPPQNHNQANHRNAPQQHEEKLTLVIGGFPKNTKGEIAEVDVKDFLKECQIVAKDVWAYKRTSVGMAVFENPGDMFRSLRTLVARQKGSDPCMTRFGNKMWVGVHRNAEERRKGTAIAVCATAFKTAFHNVINVELAYGTGEVFLADDNDAVAKWSDEKGEMVLDDAIMQKHNITKDTYNAEKQKELEKRKR